MNYPTFGVLTRCVSRSTDKQWGFSEYGATLEVRAGLCVLSNRACAQTLSRQKNATKEHHALHPARYLHGVLFGCLCG